MTLDDNCDWRTVGADKRPPSRSELVKMSRDEGHWSWPGALLGEWVRIGCPVVQVDAKLAAALMHTDVAVELDYKAPWQAFLIETNETILLGIRRIFATMVADGWCVVAWNGARALGSIGTLTELIERTEIDASMGGDILYDTPEERRAFELVKRLVLNAWLCMSDPLAVKPVGKAHNPQRSAPQRDAGQDPECKVWRLGKPVSIDLRRSVTDYVSGKGKRLDAVQWLVRGHWRNQAHGARLSERRAQWIEPHWKGDKSAPINVRPHVLRGIEP